MEECDLCLTKKKRNNKEHEQSKKHKYSSNLIINKYIVKTNEIDNFKISFNHSMTSINRDLITFLYVLCGKK